MRESSSTVPSPEDLRSQLADFAIAELVRQHRASFEPLWTVESWAKLLIWLALNSGCSGDTADLEAFAASLGEARSAELRRLFFSRELEAEGLWLVADPAEGLALLRGASLQPEEAASGPSPAERGEPASGERLPALELQRITTVLGGLGLAPRLEAAPLRWRCRSGVVVIPFR